MAVTGVSANITGLGLFFGLDYTFFIAAMLTHTRNEKHLWVLILLM